MSREEIVQLLMTIQAAYPNYKPQDKTVAVNTWCMMLEEYSYQQIMLALKAYISTDNSGFAPSIGQLIEKLHTVSVPDELNEMEAWSLVSVAIRNGYYRAEQEFAKLPPIVQKAVGMPSQLRQWSQAESDHIESVVQSNFMRSYRTVLAREKEISKMPSDIKELVAKANQNSYSAKIEKKRKDMIKSLSESESPRIEALGYVQVKGTMPDKAKDRLDKLRALWNREERDERKE